MTPSSVITATTRSSVPSATDAVLCSKQVITELILPQVLVSVRSPECTDCILFSMVLIYSNAVLIQVIRAKRMKIDI